MLVCCRLSSCNAGQLLKVFKAGIGNLRSEKGQGVQCFDLSQILEA